MPSTVIEDYLKAIYELQTEYNGARVRTSQIADYLGVTAPTATSMFSTLESNGFVEYEKYNGAVLSEEGERVALRLVRNHRLLETYLTAEFGYRLSDVHDEADRLEHHISDRFAACLADELGDPTTDPHGAPIPTSSLDVPERPRGEKLSAFDEGETVVVLEVDDRDEELLEYLSSRQVVPETELTIESVAPFGMITVRPPGHDDSVSLPDDVARLVRGTSVMDSDGTHI
ncbi:metal-dependent transcriptional regulator [Natrarchaeobius chitinivorans]|uniref:Metal-dependent transcriptional regulator n=1 Tax=Natrarchaeobius chitinivorans TaxID=1679083 RepID=A0A3N6MP17_NATCH|nr:metal-dependent transcriptional regulator [Natrarchaeobius chitinivorans]RQG97891.1 metal-dependent transcriptional regulator [Natrarchaeobius chitinivorans]